MLRTPSRILATLAGIVILIAAVTSPAAARETRVIADTWTVEIGFIQEPAIQADTNGLWLRVTERDQPVEGLEQTLQAEVIYGDAVRGLPLVPSPDEPGTYTSTFIPVQPGNYSFRLAGTVGDQPVDELFTSAPEGIAPVDARIDYEFPTAALGWVQKELAMPAALALVALGYGIATYVARRQTT